jgi:hypothetical protein
MARAAAWPQRNVPVKLTLICSSHSSSDVVRNGLLSDAGVVHEHIGPLKTSERFGNQTLHLCRFGNIDANAIASPPD